MVDRTEVNQMAKFMAALDFGGVIGAGQSANAVPESGSIAPPTRIVGDTNVAEMKAILERFHQATDNVLSEAEMDRDLRESLTMEPTPSGARMGGWEIVVRSTGKRKLYDVVHGTTQETIAADLMLYEAACGLARQLNEGGHINSRTVIDLLRAEQAYAGAIHDMRLYRHHLTASPNSPRVAIYEARYGAAKRQAVASRDEVRRLSESL